jgi:tetratricopeptide (TPR) repeat protein
VERERFDFFLSRRGAVAAIAREVYDVLTERGYRVVVQDYDIPFGASFVEAMHEAIKNARDLVILFTRDYEESKYTRKEFTAFEAERAQSADERHIIILRCEEAPLRGLLSDYVCQNLVGIDDAGERRRRIIAAAERQSQAPLPVPRPFVGVTPRISTFTGRADELDGLDAILMRDKPAAVTQALGRVAVQGMGGVGKTSLAVEYANRFRAFYAGVWWCPAEKRESLTSSLAALAVMLGVAVPEESNAEMAAKAALRRLADQRAVWLLVYDNVTSPGEIADLLPASGARVLITSRFADWRGWAEEVALDVLPLEEAVRFLQTRTGHSDPAGADVLARALACLPLALDHAAAYCRRTQLPFAACAEKAERLIATAPRGTGYPRSVAATFDLAIGEAIAQCPAAESLMTFLANCAPERIPLRLLDGAIPDEAERCDALAALTEVSLVKHDPFEDDTPAVTVHRLVQVVGRARAASNGTARGADELLIKRLAEVYPEDPGQHPGTWPLSAQLTPHVLAIEERHASSPRASDWATLLHRVGSYFHGRGHYVEARSHLEHALAIRENTLGPEHPDTASSQNALALLLLAQGEISAARSLFERALSIREARDADSRDTASSLHDLARLLRRQGDLAGARQLLDRALALRESLLGSAHPETAASIDNLGTLVWRQGDVPEARRLFQRALAIRESIGPDHPDTALSLGHLATILEVQGDYAGARSLLDRALLISEKSLGSEHIYFASRLNDLALLLRRQGEFGEARGLFERVLAIREKVLGPEHVNTNRVRRNLARVLLASGHSAEALTLAEVALSLLERAAGPKDRSTVDCARITADALDALDRGDEAKALRARFGLAPPPPSAHS